ncbi:hypothetical protein XNC3_2020009 [Xenorhabdus nematophila F1]|nr:hypothetical protein XNC3_2020009 [Xenorhabdus nematophila F1]CEK21205.1 protein of unknown function [Xenorhabdus nematophila AN6/1]
MSARSSTAGSIPTSYVAVIDKDINPTIGHLRIEDVRPRQIKIVQRGAPTVANDVLRWTRRIFDYGIRRYMLDYRRF